ncbi:hypothetical protein SVAN01_07643 [Stagonosporopsis vannaccii]|nr:hypothetical protein SVAN01_07643 [Stagonosporopsis vannaccii]
MPQTSAPRYPISQPDRPISPSFFQRLGALELFNNLLFNKERVYEGIKRASSSTGSIAREEKSPQRQSVTSEDQIVRSNEAREEIMPSKRNASVSSMGARGKPAMELRNTPSRKASAKSRSKDKRSSNKKRGTPASSELECASKIRKAVARTNSGRRVDGRRTRVDGAFVASADEDDNSLSRQETRVDSLTPRGRLLKTDPLPDLIPDAAPVQPPSTNTVTLKLDYARLRETHAKELSQLRIQLHASQAHAQHVREQAEHDALLSHRRDVAHEKAVAGLRQELEAEQQRSADLTRQCNQLRGEADAACNRLKSEGEQRDEWKRLYEEALATNAERARDLAGKDEEAARKTAETQQEIGCRAEQDQHPQRDTAALNDEDAPVSATDSSTASQTRLPPCPLTTTRGPMLDVDMRLLNLRRTYITIKKRYDNLHCIAEQVVTATRGWDVDALGEVGGVSEGVEGGAEHGCDGGWGWEGGVRALHGWSGMHGFEWMGFAHRR